MKGQLAQSVRAPASHAGGRWFESTIAHGTRSGVHGRRFFFAALTAALLLPGFIDLDEIPTGTGGIPLDGHARAINDRPIIFGKLRRDLSLEYFRRHYDPGAEDITIVPRCVVIHWTALATLEESFRCFDRETLHPARREIRQGSAVNVSAHFLVDRDGAIHRLMPETLMARHAIGLNHCAVGIENVGGPSLPLTEAQVEANARLVMDLARRHPTIRHVLGHHEYLAFRGGPLWRALDPSYRAHGTIDPGEEFMTELRARLEAYGGRGAGSRGVLSCR